MRKRLICLVGLVALIAGCHLRRSGQPVTLKWAGPQFPKEFSCVGVLVTGEGIPSVEPKIAADWESVYDGEVCPYPGISTALQPTNSTGPFAFDLLVPSGKKRTIQVIGVATSDGVCPGTKLASLIVDYKQGTLSNSITGLYEVGRASVATVQPQSVEIKNSYVAETAKNLLECVPSGDSGITLPYARLNLFVGDMVLLKPKGGKEPYKYTTNVGALTDNRFTAPTSATTGEISITDDDKKTLRLPVTISDPRFGGQLKYWFSASSHLTSMTNGQTFGAGGPWQNLGSATLTVSAIFSTGTASPRFSEDGGPRGYPSIVLPPNAYFSSSSANVTDLHHGFFAVARRDSDKGHQLLCLSNTGGCQGGSHITYVDFVDRAPQSRFSIFQGNLWQLSSTPQSLGVTDWGLIRTEFRTDAVCPSANCIIKISNNAPVPTSAAHGAVNFQIPTGYFYLGDNAGLVSAISGIEVAEVLYYEGEWDFDTVSSLLSAKYGL